jgi:hypothetical protein
MDNINDTRKVIVMMKIRFGDFLDYYRKTYTEKGTDLLDSLANWTLYFDVTEDQVINVSMVPPEDGSD